MYLNESNKINYGIEANSSLVRKIKATRTHRAVTGGIFSSFRRRQRLCIFGECATMLILFVVCMFCFVVTLYLSPYVFNVTSDGLTSAHSRAIVHTRPYTCDVRDKCIFMKSQNAHTIIITNWPCATCSPSMLAARRVPTLCKKDSRHRSKGADHTNSGIDPNKYRSIIVCMCAYARVCVCVCKLC